MFLIYLSASLESLAIKPAEAIKAIKFGIAINPLKKSDNAQTKLTLKPEPRKIHKTTKAL